MTKPEFSRPVAVAAIGPSCTEMMVEANADERAALAHRLNIPELSMLDCRFTLRRSSAARTIVADGLLRARLVQTCVVSLDEFDSEIAETFTVLFVPAGFESATMDLDAPDEIPYRDDRIDLGEAAAEQLSLSLDPFPRKPGAHYEDMVEPEPTPFAGLHELRRPS
jgi:uncharacterized metal-binding protein YceD (DUF177 family)